MSRDEVIVATAADPDIQDAIESIRSGKSDRSSPFHQVLPELTVSSDGLVLRDTRVVLPQTLVQRAVDLAHSGHQGVVKTKELLKRHVWFPRSSETVERTVKRCLHSQVNQPQNHPEPARLIPTPDGPWLEIDVDFYGPVKSKYKFVLVDRLSRFLLLRSLPNIKGPTVIAALESICCEFGFMAVLKSDNGPPFNGFEFSNWCERAGITFQFKQPDDPTLVKAKKQELEARARALEFKDNKLHASAHQRRRVAQAE